MPSTLKLVLALAAAAALAYGGWWWWTTEVMPPPIRAAQFENNGTQTVVFAPADKKIAGGRVRTLAPGGRDSLVDFPQPCTVPWVVRDQRGTELGRFGQLCEGDRAVFLGKGSVVLRQG